MPTRLHLLPWDQPLLHRAVAWLAEGWAGAGPLDLSSLLVVVPTRQSGRRLREALAARAAERGQAVFPPRVVLPETLVAAGVPEAGVASRLESLLAWVAVFRSLDLGDFREVFPVDPPARSFSWALRLAETFGRLQATLAEAGLNLAGVAGADLAEAARWQQLGELERLQAGRLAAHGLRDGCAARLAAAARPALPPGVRRIVVLAVPDPLPLATTVLAAHARTLPVDVVVFGPPGGEDLFDPWGRPRAAAWSARELALPDFESHVQVCADPLAQAAWVVACARRYGAPEGWLAVGVADGDVQPFLENGLARAGLDFFSPEGRSRRREGFFALLEALAAFAAEPTFETAAALAHNPEVLAWLGRPPAENSPGFSPARLLAGWDELRRRHLPASLAAARTHAAGLAAEFPELARSLNKLAALQATLAGGAFPAATEAALAMILVERQINPARPDDERLAAAAGAWRQMLRSAAEAAPGAETLAAADWWELALRLYGEERDYDEKPAGAVELQGWLELLWEDAPHLAVAGLNDGRVPEAVVGDPFLPETLREQLGLKTNVARFARDAYLLQALAACRASGGRLDLLLGKTSAAGDPLRPSRLLLRCPDAELPDRIAYLFRPAEVARANVPWHRAWRLRPRRAAGPRQLPVTAYRDYLRCPFRFYLHRVLGMEPVDPEKTELDALDFGNLCHAALEAMGRDPALRDCTDGAILRDFLWTELERTVRARHGTELTLPLTVQVESARQRLARAAEIQARERADGWVIEEVEWRFPESPALTFHQLPVRGKIDRLDRHEGTGAWRVLDYKTSDKPTPPRAAHCRPARTGATPDLARFTIGGRELEWTDLQLPLYVQAVADRNAACGYFNLPKAVGETGVELWADYSPSWQAAAMRCAEAVAGAVQAGRFWPPAEDLTYDDFAALFHHGAAESIEPEWAAGGGRTGS